ncbi:MAG: hypothetical protein NZV14_12420 [Bryobacteraceae bacterium]|nr:hypothetical protein [Bryobacteraceae bacterium]MDW8378958.1 hypothetical protein [Bryobacterales bacterium]
MSIQIFLQGKFQGLRDFLESPCPSGDASDAESVFIGKCWWIALLSEVLPRALLAELGLSRVLLGSSGGGQFLLVLPSEMQTRAEEFLSSVQTELAALSGGSLRLLWAATENLGDWAVVRRRLREGMIAKRGAPLSFLVSAASNSNTRAAASVPLSTLTSPADSETQPTPDVSGPTTVDPVDSTPDPTASFFRPGAVPSLAQASEYFAELAAQLVEQTTVGWSPEHPGRILLGKGKHTWTLGSEADQVPFTRHVALSDDGKEPLGASGLGQRAEGSPIWGVLRGDVDNLELRFRRAQSIEEHVQLSVLYKQFFAGELEVLCSMPEFWRKVTILYTGGDDFAAFGSWDSLILLARELQRLFRRFSEQSLKDFPGGEAKTISMALALAADPQASLARVYQEAGRMLESAKCSSRDCFSLLGRVLEWRQVAGAAELKDTMVKIVQQFGGSTQFLRELAAFYREEVFAPPNTPRKREGELEKPWRLHRRVLRVLPPARDRESEKLRASLIQELVGKNASQIKLRPAGRVALEWARLLTASAQS